MAKGVMAVDSRRKMIFPSVYTRYMKVYTVIFLALLVAYLLLTYLSEPNKAILQHYNLSLAGYYWLITTIVFLIVLISVAALYGSIMVRAYSNRIDGTPDGKAFESISFGLLVLSIAVPLNSVLNAIMGLLVKHNLSWQPTLTIINNYISLALAALAFALIAKGSEELYKIVRRTIKPAPQKLWVFLFIVFSSLYSYFIIRKNLTTPVNERPYFLPDWLLISTIVIPYLYFWYRGFNAAYNLFIYQKNVHGKLYKRSLVYLAVGFLSVIIISIAARVLVTVTPSLNSLKLTPILIIIYALLLFEACGFFLIAVGAKKLRQIEEI